MKKLKKVFAKDKNKCIIIVPTIKSRSFGGAPDSIAGERKDKHTVDEVTTIKHFN